MIAQKLKNNCIAIGQNSTLRDDAVEVIYELRVSEFYKLVKSTNSWVNKLADKRDIMFAQYADENSKIVKEFNSIYARRKNFYEREMERAAVESVQQSVQKTEPSTSKKQTEINYPSTMIGTSKLVRIPSKQLIKIVRRKGKNDCINKPNSVCISNECRERFFSDVKKTTYYQNTKNYEMLYSNEDQVMYERWSEHIDKIYKKGLGEYNGNT